jgi:hypothetical protein
MSPVESRNLIAAAGGDTAFAKILGIADDPGHQQRVNNWKRRGIPPAVVLEHYEALQRLKSATDSPPAARKRKATTSKRTGAAA